MSLGPGHHFGMRSLCELKSARSQMRRGQRDLRRGRIVVVGRRRGPRFDYIIENDAMWATIPAALLTDGGRVGVAPGTYTTKTLLSINPSATLTFAATQPSSKPRIDTLLVNASSDIRFEDLQLVSSSWASSPVACLRFQGAVSDLSFLRCDFIGNYRGTIGDPSFDVTLDTYPEYACIRPIFNSSGAVTGFDVNRPTVGDLLADGTYSMVFNNYGGVTFSVAPVATFTVSGGQITGTTLTSGGSSNATDTTGSGIRTALVTWAGQQRMFDYMPSAWRSISGSTMGGTILFQDCTIDLCNSGFKPFSSANAHLIVDNCSFDRVYQDFMSFSGMSPITIRDCFGTRPFSAGDAGDPHSDFIQLVHAGSGSWSGVTIERNIFITGNARGGMQGIFVEDAGTGDYLNPRIVGNCVLSQGSINGLSLNRPADGFVYANLIGRYDPTDTVRNTSAYVSSISSASGDVFWARNIGESLPATGAVIDSGGLTNLALGLNGATVSYGDVFANHTGSRTTKAEVVAAYTPKISYAGLGPFANTSYINHVSKSTNLDLEPTFARFTALQNATASSTVTSDWSRIVGGPSSGSVSVSGGEYRFADDSSGTNATSWTSASGTYTRDKFVQTQHSTPGTGVTDTTTTLTFRGLYTAEFTSTTASLASFTEVDNQATAYSTFSVSSLSGETGIRKVVLAVRFKPDAITANANIFCGANNAIQRLWFPTTTSIRYQFNGTTRQLRPSFTPTTDWRTHIITLDFTQADDTGCYWATIEDGLLLNNNPGTGGDFTTGGGTLSLSANGTNQMFGTTGSIGCFADGLGANVFDGRMAFFYMHWGDESFSLPDITQSSVRNLFTADLIGANGNGPTGTQPKFYFTGSLTDWNSGGGLANLGTLTSRPLIKQTGTYA